MSVLNCIQFCYLEEYNMADRIKQYMAYVDALLESDDDSIDWNEEIRKHLVQIAFFAHERFIHLIVTVTFAIMSILVFIYAFGNFTPSIGLLIFALLVLLIPYIKHYFLLENSVQDMYEQYDKMLAKAGNKSFVRQGKYKR